MRASSMIAADLFLGLDRDHAAVISEAVEQRRSVTQAVMRHRLATFEPRIAKRTVRMRGRYGVELSASEQTVLLRLLDTRRVKLALSFERDYGTARMRSERPKEFMCQA